MAISGVFEHLFEALGDGIDIEFFCEGAALELHRSEEVRLG
jgi:hypothetical protein